MDNTASWLVFIVIAGLVGLAINHYKGKSKAWGFAGGAIFGIFGWLFLALHSGGRQYACPACREKINPGATLCRHCGTKFEQPVGVARYT